jgi:hypothetical protein
VCDAKRFTRLRPRRLYIVVGNHQPCEWLYVRLSAGELTSAKEDVQHRLRWYQQDRLDCIKERTNASEMFGSVAAIFANGTGGGIDGWGAAIADRSKDRSIAGLYADSFQQVSLPL